MPDPIPLVRGYKTSPEIRKTLKTALVRKLPGDRISASERQYMFNVLEDFDTLLAERVALMEQVAAAEEKIMTLSGGGIEGGGSTS